MTRDDIRKLLGGYSTGTLTPEEERALFAAALEDQELFDALAKEQALRDLLRDPAARAQVLAALDERPEPWWRWLRWPAAVGATAGCLAAVVGFGIWHARQTQPPVLVAANREVKVAPVQAAPPAGEPAAAADTGRHENLSAPGKPDRVAVNGLVSGRTGRPAPLEAPASRDARSAPAAVEFEKGAIGAAGKQSRAEEPSPVFAQPGKPASPQPETRPAAAAPPPRQFAAAPRPVVLKKEEDGDAGAANRLVVSGNESAPPPQQRAAVQAAPARAGFKQVRRDAAAEADQLAMKGAVSQSALGQAHQNQADLPVQQAAAPTQSVEVTAAAPQVEVQSANNQRRADLPAAQRQVLDMAAKAAATPEVKWSALRRGPHGRLSPVALDRIRAGDTIVVRLEPWTDGTLSVAESMPGAAPLLLMADTRVRRAGTVDTPAVTLDHPGVRELLVSFTPRTAAVASGGIASRAERPSAAPLSQTIELRYR